MADYLPDVIEPRPDDALRRNKRIVELLRAAASMIEIATTLDGDLPEVMSVGVTTDEITIQPWAPGAPIRALTHFEPLMDPPIERKAYPLVLQGAETVSMLTIAGNVDGHRVVVSAATHRDLPVDGFLGVSEQTVAAIAANEVPITDPQDSDVLPTLIKEIRESSGAGDPDSGPAQIAGADQPGLRQREAGAGEGAGPGGEEGRGAGRTPSGNDVGDQAPGADQD